MAFLPLLRRLSANLTQQSVVGEPYAAVGCRRTLRSSRLSANLTQQSVVSEPLVDIVPLLSAGNSVGYWSRKATPRTLHIVVITGRAFRYHDREIAWCSQQQPVNLSLTCTLFSAFWISVRNSVSLVKKQHKLRSSLWMRLQVDRCNIIKFTLNLFTSLSARILQYSSSNACTNDIMPWLNK